MWGKICRHSIWAKIGTSHLFFGKNLQMPLIQINRLQGQTHRQFIVSSSNRHLVRVDQRLKFSRLRVKTQFSYSFKDFSNKLTIILQKRFRISLPSIRVCSRCRGSGHRVTTPIYTLVLGIISCLMLLRPRKHWVNKIKWREMFRI